MESCRSPHNRERRDEARMSARADRADTRDAVHRGRLAADAVVAKMILAPLPRGGCTGRVTLRRPPIPVAHQRAIVDRHAVGGGRCEPHEGGTGLKSGQKHRNRPCGRFRTFPEGKGGTDSTSVTPPFVGQHQSEAETGRLRSIRPPSGSRCTSHPFGYDSFIEPHSRIVIGNASARTARCVNSPRTRAVLVTCWVPGGASRIGRRPWFRVARAGRGSRFSLNVR